MCDGRTTQLFNTDGGTNVYQLELLLKLLKENSVDITEEMYNNCRLTRVNDETDNNKPKRIYLVLTNVELENPKDKLEDVMMDLEEKVNPKSVEDGLSKIVTAIQTNDPSMLLVPMQLGAKEFEERVGRPMTYIEMRSMWG